MSVDVERVQAYLLEMAKTVVEILDKNRIPYVLMCGTLLGAIRHNGFIPWDDDFDICLFDDTYDQALKVLRESLPNNLFVEDNYTEPKYFHAWAHVKDLKTRAYCQEFPQDNSYSHNGLYIDLYKLVRIDNTLVDKYLIDENLAYIQRRKQMGLINEDDYENRLNAILNKTTYKHIKNDFESKQVFTWISPYKCKTIEIKDVFPLKMHKFEDVEFSIPNHAEKILTNIYGNYMELPPKDKRILHYSKVEFF